MQREQLIYYSHKYHGEYSKIFHAIKTNETFELMSCDKCITILDDEYPDCFLRLAYPPFVIYYRGDITLLKTEMIGIVGSRKACDYAINATNYLVDQIKDRYTIVSGLALGIDGVALNQAKRAVGILGSGIDYIYPLQNKKLIEYCYEKQLVLSEYPGMALPLKHHFPFRNRLIAALSSRIYVMQASHKSGTMTTVRQALDLNKDIYVLPYRIFDKEGSACNDLIVEGANVINFSLNNNVK